MRRLLKVFVEWLRELRYARANARALAAAQITAMRYKEAAEGMWKEEHERLRKMGEGARCGHPRQITADGDVLPCAWPMCKHGTGNNWLREMVRWRPMLRLSDPPLAEDMPPVRTYERREAYVAEDGLIKRSYFWILR